MVNYTVTVNEFLSIVPDAINTVKGILQGNGEITITTEKGTIKKVPLLVKAKPIVIPPSLLSVSFISTIQKDGYEVFDDVFNKTVDNEAKTVLIENKVALDFVNKQYAAIYKTSVDKTYYDSLGATAEVLKYNSESITKDIVDDMIINNNWLTKYKAEFDAQASTVNIYILHDIVENQDNYVDTYITHDGNIQYSTNFNITTI